MPADDRIDDLYKVSPDQFVSARNALAKTLTGEEAKRVKALAKPTIVPWSVNQVYWHARDVYNRLLKAGEKLRDTQVSALKGSKADVRGATAAHRQALADAVKKATQLAADSGAHPDADQLARMFEALSLVKTPPEPHGRFTKPLQPQGFEALAGVAIKPGAASVFAPAPKTAAPAAVPRATRASQEAEARKARQREREAAAARRHHAAELKKAETRLSHAQAAEERARKDWETAKTALGQAEHAVAELRRRSP